MAPELPESLREVAERAASVLAPESDLFEDMDSAGFGDALSQAVRSALTHPVQPARSALHLASDLVKIPLVAGARWFGREVQPPVEVDPKDRRFSAPAWSTNPAYYSVRLAYLSASKFAKDVVESAPMDPETAQKARMALSLLADTLAPTNFLATNPAALQRAFDTAGGSLVKGAKNFVDDVRQQRRQAPPGRHQRLRGRRQPRLHAGEGGVPQRVDGAAAVRAADRAGARHAVAVQPAVDQQVLRDGPGAGPQLHRVGGPARPHRVRDQLHEPVRRHVRHHDGRLPAARPADRARRHPGDHRRRDDRHRRPVPGRRDDRDHRRVPDPAGRQPGRHAHPAQHHARLRRARCAGHVHRQAHRREAREEDAEGRAARGRDRWPAPSTSCGPTT